MAFRNPIRGRIRCRGLRTAGAGGTSRLPTHPSAGSLPGRNVKRPQLFNNHLLHEQRPQVTHGRTSEPKEQQRFSRVAAPLQVYAPSREDTEVASSNDSAESSGDQYDIGSVAIDPSEDSASTSSSVSTTQILAPVKADMEAMNANLRSIVGGRHPLLVQAADQIFGAGGKKLRPAIVFLAARATCACTARTDLTQQHRRLAEIVEMIHTASLVHDDVLDESSVRRGAPTVNKKFGTKVAVLVGDFLFAQSSWFLAQLDNLEVIKLISQVIADFANGEISQQQKVFDSSITLDEYMDKNFYKTASLIAASCKSAAVFSGCSQDIKDSMFEYGRHLGLAFQIIDDILDFTQTAEQLGKPQGQDLASGNLTAPVLFALQSKCGSELLDLIDSEFVEEGDLQRAIDLVREGGGVAAAKQLACEEADKALASLSCLDESEAKQSMEGMVSYVLDRLY
ncbi:hypothetical protein ABBQ32_008346 [Trebouxia sp. C0010 RCD-2024]